MSETRETNSLRITTSISVRFGFGDKIKSCRLDLDDLQGNVRRFIDGERDSLLL